MAQAIAETVFEVAYLIWVVAAGVIMIRRGQTNPTLRLYGVMAVVLGGGDSFHLVPRMAALWGSGLEAHAASLGVGKLVTSVTMTVFYLLLYFVWRRYYRVEGRTGLTIAMWALAALRVGLCLLPQNQWLSPAPPLLWGVLRNIPFAAMGVLLIALFAGQARKTRDRLFRWMPLAIGLSFAFYIPVVLFAELVPMVGMLMIPKTLAYVWVVAMGFGLQKQTQVRLEPAA